MNRYVNERWIRWSLNDKGNIEGEKDQMIQMDQMCQQGQIKWISQWNQRSQLGQIGQMGQMCQKSYLGQGTVYVKGWILIRVYLTDI